jgi:hypothetical protein
MWLERNCYGLSSGSAGPRNDFPQYMRMRAVHSIKIPDADQRGAVIRRHVFEFVKNLHGDSG